MKVLLFANTDWYLFNFRLPLARALRERGHEVVLVSPPGRFGEALIADGFSWRPFAISRKGINPFAELVTLVRLVRLYRRERPDLAHHFTIKCVLYGGIAARLAGVPATVSAITGLGHLFTADSIINRMLRPMVRSLYRMALAHSEVIFQNPDDQKDFIAQRLVNADRCHLIRGSGVNVDRFAPRTIEARSSMRVIMVARMLREKGVEQYAQAAQIVRARIPNAEFLLVGDSDPGNPSSIDAATLARLSEPGGVKVLGHRDDVAELLQDSDLAVLPTYYGEGTPRSLIEAAACGLPIVATDVPGCREIVRDGDNGLLVPAMDSRELAGAIVSLLRNPALRKRMGQRSRDIACNGFAEDKVIEATLSVYDRAFGLDDIR